MSNQLDLFNGITDTKFPQYHLDNPHIYEAFKKYAFEAINCGRKHFSSEAIINRIRWDSMIKGTGEYKINNNYKSFYSRMFANEFPQYCDFFFMRKSKFDSINLEVSIV